MGKEEDKRVSKFLRQERFSKTPVLNPGFLLLRLAPKISFLPPFRFPKIMK
jgi:hypothetical protein